MSDQTAKVIRFPTRMRDDEVWEPWLTEQMVAQHFKVSPRTVRRWRMEGMPSGRLGSSRRFRLSAIEDWHAERSAS